MAILSMLRTRDEHWGHLESSPFFRLPYVPGPGGVVDRVMAEYHHEREQRAWYFQRQVWKALGLNTLLAPRKPCRH